MESFLESAASASRVADVDFAVLDTYLVSVQGSDNGLKEALSTLVDAYGAGSSGSHQTAIMHGIVSVVTHAARVKTATPTTAAALGTEDYLLLLLFLNDFTPSITDTTLLSAVMALVAQLFEHGVPLAFGVRSATGEATDSLSEDEHASRLDLRSELISLQAALLKRLTTTVPALRRQALYQCVLRAMHHISRALVAPCYDEVRAFADARGPKEDTAAEAALEGALADLLEGLLAPFHAALDHQQASQRGAGSAGTSPAALMAGGTSPLLLCAAFQALEDLLWLCHDAASSSPSGPGRVLSRTFTKAVSQLLLALQQYLSVRQRRELEDGDGSTRDAADQPFDLTRNYATQRAVQRVLSVLHVVEKASTADRACPFELPEALWSGVRAAAAAFGGFVELTSPFSGPAIAARPTTTTTAEWEEAAAECVVPCLAVLSGAWGADGSAQGLAGAGLEDDELGLHGAEAVLRTSFGVVSVTSLVDMVMRSIEQLDLVGEDVIRDLHFQGLQHMQYDAACRAQREEYERQRKLDQQGVDAIPAGRLLEHVKDAKQMHDKGIQTLRHAVTRAVLERAAFSSVLSSYACLQDELESTVREVQALVAHCLVKLPSSLSDSATDELLDLLRTELQEEKKAKDAHAKADNPQARRHNFALVGRTSSYFQLVLQTLFMLYATNAPVRERTAHAFLLTANTEFGAEEMDAAGGAAGSGLGQALRTNLEFAIDTENPIAFLQEEDVHVPSYQIGKKRTTRDGAHQQPHHGTVPGLDLGEPDDDAFAFLNDTAASPCAYSHILCRLLELIDSCGLDQLIVEVLLQAPALTRRVWSYLFRHFCLSHNRRRCEWGLLLLTTLAQRRPVYRACAINILLYMTTDPNSYARRVAIHIMGDLLKHSASGDTVWNCVIDGEAEQQLIHYAKRQLAVLPVYEFHLSRAGAADESDEERRARVTEVLNRHLGLFLMLCVRQPRQLFPSLLDTFKECVERDRGLVVAALPEIPDLRAMVQGLFDVNPTSFLATMMPPLRRYSRDVPVLVQSLMQSIADRLKPICAQLLEATNTAGGGAVNSAAIAAAVADLRKITAALVSHLLAMYENSLIPLSHESASTTPEGQSGAVLHDTRFLTPFLSFLPAHDLLQSYLFSFLSFVQVQLQFQRQHGLQVETLTAKQRSYVLTAEEQRALIVTTIREVETNPTAALASAPEEGPRGLARTDFFIFLHRAAQESVRRSAAAGSALPHIGVSTTREVITVCLDLYSPAEVQEAIRRMVQSPPVPSQLMVTVLLAADSYVRSRKNPDFLRFVEQVVLGPLERASTWERDPQLWRGILLFVEKYYRECSSFLVNLPDSVLVQALRDLPKLRDMFMEEHGNNASFGHILGNL